MNAVAVQMSSVSMNTDSICTRPCLAGWETDAVAAAFGAEPIPASFEYRPRFTPYMMQLPEKPPITDWKSNALRKIDANIPGTFLMFRQIMSSETSTYRIPMNGTRISVMLARRFAPPSTITPNRNARMTPMNAGVITGW